MQATFQKVAKTFILTFEALIASCSFVWNQNSSSSISEYNKNSLKFDGSWRTKWILHILVDGGILNQPKKYHIYIYYAFQDSKLI